MGHIIVQLQGWATPAAVLLMGVRWAAFVIDEDFA
jgi:hypothetical protein